MPAAVDLIVDLEGLPELEAAFRRMGPRALEFCRDAVNEAAINIQTTARKKLTDLGAVDVGRLRSAIRIIWKDDRLEISASVGTDVIYAAYIEHGTGPAIGEAPFFMPKGILLPWMRRHGIPEEAEYVIRRAIGKKGQKPKPFLFPAFEEERPKLVPSIERKLSQLGGD